MPPRRVKRKTPQFSSRTGTAVAITRRYLSMTPRQRLAYRQKYGNIVTDALSYTGRKFKEWSPTIYDYGRRALSPVATAARVGGRLAMSPLRATYQGAKLAAGFVPGGRLALRLIKKPVKWAIRNPGDALLLGGTAIMAAGVGAGMYENALGDYAVLEKLPIIGPMIKGGAGIYQAGTDAAKAGEGVRGVGSSLWEVGRMGKHALQHARAGEYVKVGGKLVRAGIEGAKAAGHTAGALFYTGKSAGHAAQAVGDIVVQPAKQILSPVWEGTKHVYQRFAPHETIRAIGDAAGFTDAAPAAATFANPGAAQAAYEIPSTMPYLDSAVDWAMSPVYSGAKYVYTGAKKMLFGKGAPRRRFSQRSHVMRAARAVANIQKMTQ